MRRLLRGASAQQTYDDIEQKLGTVKLYQETPDLALIQDGEIAIVRGTGQVIYRDGEDVYQLTGTKIN